MSDTLVPVQKGTRKNEIIKQAHVLFRNRGYTATSVRDLAQESGIEAPSLYSHFKSKEDILQLICFETSNAFMKGLGKAESKKGTEEKLSRAIREHIKVVTNNLDGAVITWNEWKHLTSPYLEDFKDMLHEYENRFKKIVKKGIKSRTFRKSDAETVSNLLLSTLNSIPFWFQRELISSKNLSTLVIDTFYKGILNKKKK